MQLKVIFASFILLGSLVLTLFFIHQHKQSLLSTAHSKAQLQYQAARDLSFYQHDNKDQGPHYYHLFEQSLPFKALSPLKIKSLFLYLSKLSGTTLNSIYLKPQPSHHSHYQLWEVVLEVKALSDHEIMLMIHHLNLPNVLALKEIHVNRMVELTAEHLKQLQEQPGAVFLVGAKMTLTWLNWNDF